MNKLPDKKSELIRLAVADLEKCEADPKYNIDMTMWIEPDDELCCVCLAGAIMTQEFGFMSSSGSEWDENFDTYSDEYSFLNNLRCYDSGGLWEIWYKVKGAIPPKKRKLYSEDSIQFKRNMLQIADWYEEIGE